VSRKLRREVAHLVDNDNEAGHEGVQREQRRVERRERAASQTSTLGPGTVGHTISGAAYRGQEIAADIGAPSPAEPGFGERFGLGYNDAERGDDYAPAQRTEAQRPR
jgi:hypothetical protein